MIEAGLGLLESDGPEALNARKLAGEIGASTMTVYTHFGGMAGLYEALIRRVFVQFGEALAEIERTEDPVTDLLALGVAYREFALASPQRYRLMFGMTAPGSENPVARDLTTEGSPSGIAEASATFEQLHGAVRRSLDAGRIHGDDSVAIAGQFWSLVHGFVLLEMSGFFGQNGEGVTTVLAPHAKNLLLGLGDDPARTEASLQTVLAWAAARGTTAKNTPQVTSIRHGRRPRANR